MKMKSFLSVSLSLLLCMSLAVPALAAPLPDQKWTANWLGGTDFTASVTTPHDYLGTVKIGGLVDLDGNTITSNFDVFVVADDVTSLSYTMYTNNTKGFEIDALTMKNLYTVLGMYDDKVSIYSTADIGGDDSTYIGTKANPFLFALEVSPDRLNIANETLGVYLGNDKSSWINESAVILTQTQLSNFKATGTLPPVFSGSIYETGDNISSKLNLNELKDLLNGKKPLSVKVTSLKLSATTLTLTKGKTATLKATIAPSNATTKAVTWTTSNAKVVTVDKNGNIKAVGKGKATITATTTDGSKLKKTCNVTVK